MLHVPVCLMKIEKKSNEPERQISESIIPVRQSYSLTYSRPKTNNIRKYHSCQAKLYSDLLQAKDK